MNSTKEIILTAKRHEADINQADSHKKNLALKLMADNLIKQSDKILEANLLDVKNAKGKVPDVMIDRLFLNKSRLDEMADGLYALVDLPDPVGIVLSENVLPNGLVVKKVSVPFGLIAMIYESRPNVTSDAAGLAIKIGNAVVLRSGKEAINSAKAIVSAMRKGLDEAGISKEVLQLLPDTSRESAKELMTAKGLVDLLVPRGGKGLISTIVKNSTVPVIETGTGICHIYVDKTADVEMALNVINNAKTSRPSVCNAAEVCVVHKDVAADFLPKLSKLFKDRVELVADERAIEFFDCAKLANEEDFNTEFLDYKMAVAVVDSVDDAIKHINLHSTGHSESIITNEKESIEKFTNLIDSSSVYVNASTRFTDGGQFGLGCELGISTQKLHARGPMGLQEITTYKYVIYGSGQIRE